MPPDALILAQNAPKMRLAARPARTRWRRPPIAGLKGSYF